MSTTIITTKPTLLNRIVNWFTPSKVRAINQHEAKPTEVKHGATWVQPYGVRPTYSQEEAMSAYAGHGYTYAAVSRASQDLGALPLRLLRGKDKQLIETSPVIDLMNQPSMNCDGYLFREQLCTDIILTGNCYILLLGATEKPTSIVRLHPQNVKIATDSTGISGYVFDSGGQRVIYPPDRVVHGRLASWNNGPSEILGTGAIEPLARELTADINSQNLVSNASAKARPDLLISPKDPADIWGPDMRKEIASEYKKMSAEGGAMVLSGLADVQPLVLSPREMEYVKAREMARESISAVTGVPPSVLGLPSANYALSRQQARNYWSVQTKRGKRLAILYTAIAQKFDSELVYEHDYSGVEALQEARTEQLQRVQMHIQNGVSPQAAYKYEGLDYPDNVEGAAADQIDETTEDNRSYLAKMYTDSESELKKKQAESRWHTWIKTYHDPATKELNRAVKSYLRGAAKRYQKRLKENLKQPKTITVKGIIDWDDLLSINAEAKMVAQVIGPVWKKWYVASGESMLNQIARKGGRTAAALEGITMGQPDQEIVNLFSREIARTGATKVQMIVENGLTEGLPYKEIAKQIDASTGFGPARSMRIAQTEANRAGNLGTQNALTEATAAGVKMQKMWMSSLDDRVRETHQDLEGTIIGVNEEFVIDGASAIAPSNFGVASEDINCRCGITPIIPD